MPTCGTVEASAMHQQQKASKELLLRLDLPVQ
jgi:hypothetical protein